MVSSITSVFLESSSARVLAWELISTWFLLDCRKLTRSKLVKRFSCVDLNEEMRKQYVSDQLLMRRNNSLLYISFQLFINWAFLVFFWLVVSRSYFCSRFLYIRGSVITFEVSLFKILDATVCLMYLFVDQDIASWQQGLSGRQNGASQENRGYESAYCGYNVTTD